MKLMHYLFVGIIFTTKIPYYCVKYAIIGLITTISIIPKYVIDGIKFIFLKKNTSKENKKLEKNFIPIIITTLSVTTYLISIFILTRWYVQNERTKKFTNSIYTAKEETNKQINKQTNKDIPNQYQDLTNNIKQEKTSTNPNYINTNFINVNLNYYISKNNETVGWIQVNGTNINYPIVQHEDNNFYLEHDFYKRKTNIGWIFADYRDDMENLNNNTIIYGHNLINRTMFGSIPYMLNKKWFNKKNNHYIKLSTKNSNSIWEIFSVYKIEPTTDYLQSVFNSIENYQNFLDMLKSRSIIDFNIELSYTDKIITLSTCDDTGTKRVAVHAKLIKIENK